jgi:hypothetical protein
MRNGVYRIIPLLTSPKKESPQIISGGFLPISYRIVRVYYTQGAYERIRPSVA